MLRVGGKLCRKTIGRYPAWSLADARREALRLQREAGEGAEASPFQAAPAAPDSTGPTYAELVASYVDLHLRPNNRSWKASQSCLRQEVVQPFMDRSASSITRAEVVAVLDSLVKLGKPHAGVALLKGLRAMYAWAVARDAVQANPCTGVRPPAKTTQRSRVLTDAEIVAVLGACDKVPAPFGDMVRLLLYTAARRNEVAQMRWAELEGTVWTIPAERSKSGRANSLPLPPQAMAVIERQPRFVEGDFVFTTTMGRRPSSDFAKRKRKLDIASGVGLTEADGWRLHDTRRSVRTKLSQLGVSRDVARRILGHAGDTLDEIYDRHTHEEQKRNALELLADDLDRLVTTRPTRSIRS